MVSSNFPVITLLNLSVPLNLFKQDRKKLLHSGEASDTDSDSKPQESGHKQGYNILQLL